MNHLEEVALQYRSVGGGGGDTVCTTWFSAMLIIWRLPYTGQCCIDCVLQGGGGGGTVCTTWFSESFGGGCPTQVSAV